MKRTLHIVCLDCPTPADYGGAIDMFYRIEALSQAGISIHLHYFSYNEREPDEKLNQLCTAIHAYKRETGRKGLLSKLPYIVASRINKELIEKINSDDHPVLLEGFHCTGIITYLRKDKKIAVRIHNDEAAYYRHLAASAGNILKKIYYLRESRLLKKYQQSLPADLTCFSISKTETGFFNSEYGLRNVHHIPAFIPFRKVTGEEGLGHFCLYHGNLGVEENEKAALWLIKEVFTRIKMKLVIAGKEPSAKLKRAAAKHDSIRVVDNPSAEELGKLVNAAHINVLPSFSKTGVKLKLLYALFQGRHCVVNPEMTEGTGAEAACHTGVNATAFASIIMQLKNQPFTPEEIVLRRSLLEEEFNNEQNARRLIQYLY